jgi:hypothetical protein
MKKIATLTLGCLVTICSYGQTFSDDFESYTAGIALGPQSPDWRTWGGAGGGADDVDVATSDNHTVAGSKSLYFSSTSATGGPEDVVLPFNASPLTTGQFSYTMWVKIPTAKTAYFNFQGNATMGNMYTLDCWMDAATGSVVIQNSGTTVVSGTIPVNAWFELSVTANLNTNSWDLLIDGVSQGTWSNANNQIYAIDLYPADAQASFWVDDVSYYVVPYTLPALNAAGNLVSVENGLVGQSRNVSVKVRNLGTGTITSFGLSVDQNGGTPVVQNVTGVSIVSMATYTVNITTPFVLAAGPNTFTATISNVNGAGPDGDASDDVIAATVTPVTPAAGKMVVAEEGTGTWCVWCPRGAVYMDAMASKYDGYFAGIAVHNGSNDPMVHAAYDAAIGGLIGGYPSALVNRNPEIDPMAIEGDFLDEIVIAPKALLVNTRTFNTTTRVLDVTVNTTIQTAITGNYKLACVLTEDEVTGTTSGYAQANAYAGGGAGPMGGYESLPNPVPASMMVYNHVARDIQPSFAGMSNAYGTSAAAGATFTHNFSFTLPSSWDVTKMHVVSMFIEPTGKINNASSVNAATVGINEEESNVNVSLYPNPSNDNSNILVELKKVSEVSVQIFSVNGALVASKNYGSLNGNVILPVNSGNFSPGMYFVNILVDGQKSVHKLVKQ